MILDNEGMSRFKGTMKNYVEVPSTEISGSWRNYVYQKKPLAADERYFINEIGPTGWAHLHRIKSRLPIFLFISYIIPQLSVKPYSLEGKNWTKKKRKRKDRKWTPINLSCLPNEKQFFKVWNVTVSLSLSPLITWTKRQNRTKL